DGAELLSLRKEVLTSAFVLPDESDGMHAVTPLLDEEQLKAVRAATYGRPYPVHVLLTGGSASIPIVQDLSTGELELAGTRFRFQRVDRLPDWIDRLPRGAAQLLADVYLQCAVAIGGSVPELPEELNDLEIPVMPPLRGTRRLPRSQITGL